MSYVPPPPPVPEKPVSPEDEAQQKEILRLLDEAPRLFSAKNMRNAISLAIEASHGHGTLVDHFHELGRRYGASSAQKQTERPAPMKQARAAKRTARAFRVIEGGAA